MPRKKALSKPQTDPLMQARCAALICAGLAGTVIYAARAGNTKEVCRVLSELPDAVSTGFAAVQKAGLYRDNAHTEACELAQRVQQAAELALYEKGFTISRKSMTRATAILLPRLATLDDPRGELTKKIHGEYEDAKNRYNQVPRSSTKRKARNQDRDQFAYDQRKAGKALKDIMADANAQDREWTPFSTDRHVHRAIVAYAERETLPKLSST